jgi:hypothetical protein
MRHLDKEKVVITIFSLIALASSTALLFDLMQGLYPSHLIHELSTIFIAIIVIGCVWRGMYLDKKEWHDFEENRNGGDQDT